MWVMANGEVVVWPAPGEWKRGEREGVWHQGLLLGESGYLEEKGRWIVYCSLRCQAPPRLVTSSTLERLTLGTTPDESVIWLDDLTRA
jgi:hypothetical protein